MESPEPVAARDSERDGNLNHASAAGAIPAPAPDAAYALELVPEEGTTRDGDGEGRVLVYPSSLEVEGESLLTLRTFGRGMRLTATQARALHDWIGDWLNV